MKKRESATIFATNLLFQVVDEGHLDADLECGHAAIDDAQVVREVAVLILHEGAGDNGESHVQEVEHAGELLC